MRNRLYLFNIFPKKIIIVYFIGLLAILLTSAFVVIVGLSQVATFGYASANQSAPGISFGNGTLITEHDARTVYSSRVPATIADAMNKMNSTGKIVYAMTLTPVNVNGVIPLVVRGIPESVVVSEGLAGSQIINETSNIVLIGHQAEQRLHSKVGSNVTIQSPFTATSLNLTVNGFFTTGTEEDYEMVVSLPLGEAIAGLPKGIVNAIMVPSSIPFNPKILDDEYLFNIDYSGPAGNVLFIDSSGYVHNSFQTIPPKGLNLTQNAINVTLPFGLYNVVLERGGLRTTLTQFVTNTNQSTIRVNSTFSRTEGFLNVITVNGSLPAPSLVDNSNKSVSPLYFDQAAQSWVFPVPFGTYSLKVNNSIYKVFVFGNATFDISSLLFNSFLNIRIHSDSPQEVGYSITIKDNQSSRIIFSSYSITPNLTIPVESNHAYVVAILTSGSLFMEKNVFTSKNTTVIFNIPYVPQQLQNAPIFDYSSLGVGFPSQTASFDYFFGTISASTIALFSIIILLLVLTLLLFDSQFLAAIRNETKAVAYMFPRRRTLFWRIGFPLLLVSLAASVVALGVSLFTFQMLPMTSMFTFIGYGIEFYPMLYVAPALTILSVLSWARASLFLNKRIQRTVGSAE